jgi:hypothetical protein
MALTDEDLLAVDDGRRSNFDEAKARREARPLLAQVDVDPEEHEGPDDDGDHCLADCSQRVEVIEVVVDRGHDDSDDQVDPA